MKKLVVPAALAGGLFLSLTAQEAFAASGQDIVRKAEQFQGKPYKYAAPAYSTDAFDCSSFTQFIFREVMGMKLPRNSALQAGTGAAVDRSALQPGDLLFFDTLGDGRIHHVGIYIGGGQMISSEETVGVHITNVFSGGGSQNYWEEKFVTARRVAAPSTPVSTPEQNQKPGNSTSSDYTVKSGDSLWAIARSHGTSVGAIKSANGLGTDLIFPGQKLKLTASAGAAAPSSQAGPASSQPAKASSASEATYTVKSGDSLWAIAIAKGTTVSAIKSANGLRTDLIFPGQKLKLSGSAAPAAQTDQARPTTGSSDNRYTVASGDSLWEIATAHGITVNRLMRANNLSATIIYPGQHLIIPG
ncbi:LysM peptidoglycan-binding domain-containing protein [Sporolactobacillus sp. Y61]|uniref:LysM peptidoglycan-binding domain-containing protein n=1 Tax=Sporolactobacillus sp. Y61 TaxID=3160863 RepID=A0AAU8IH41_9BACL